MDDYQHPGVWCCEHRDKCKWPAFSTIGLSWGTTPGASNIWRNYHDRYCGGRLIQLLQPSTKEPNHAMDTRSMSERTDQDIR